MIRILIADDHQMFIDGLKSMLEDVEGIMIVEEAMNGLEVIEICHHAAVDIVIMDVSMPKMDGVEATRTLLKKHPHIKVLGLSMFNDRNYISDMLKAGAHGYILKNTGKEELLKAIHTLESGESYLGKEVKKSLLTSFLKKSSQIQLVEKPTEREQEVLGCIAAGFTTNEIASQLFISKSTVETHRKNLLYKLKARNTAELVNNAYKKRIIK